MLGWLSHGIRGPDHDDYESSLVLSRVAWSCVIGAIVNAIPLAHVRLLPAPHILFETASEKCAQDPATPDLLNTLRDSNTIAIYGLSRHAPKLQGSLVARLAGPHFPAVE
jgi:hypothetical protein